MIFLRSIATVAVTGMMFSSTVAAALAQSNRVTICHRTGSATNPYVKITISENALPAHQAHGDFLATSAGCEVPPPETNEDCVVSFGVVQVGNTVTGTSGNDTIDCTNAPSAKIITGGDGNDTITGSAFNDVIDAGNGNDTVTGGPGDDVIEGGNGNDTVTGGPGEDVVTDNGDGEDTITP
jgi:Ca2+-binding RTX toxin-like protein